MKKGRLLANAYLVLVFGFLYVPIAVLIAFSFNESKSRTVFTGFTFKWYQNLFHNDMVLKSLGVSLGVAFAAACIATVVGTLAAIGIRATVQPVDATTWYNDVYVGRQFDATITGLDAKNITARAMLERFVSDNGKNFVNYNNPAYDELYAKARACADDAEQTALYQQMETMLTETAANLYLQDMADLVAIHSGLTGYTFYPIYAQDLSTVGWE